MSGSEPSTHRRVGAGARPPGPAAWAIWAAWAVWAAGGPLLAVIGASRAAAAVDAPAINATLEPRQIVLGESAELTITTSGSSLPSIKLPSVNGLVFGVMGTSRRISLINGAMISSTSTIVRVTPQTAGIFTIPGLTPQSQPLVLQVAPDANASPNAYGAPSRAPIVPNGTTGAGGVKLTADGSAFVKLLLPKRDFYVGENIPVEIQIGMRDGVVTSLNGFPALGGNDFTLNNLSHQPERAEKAIDGKPFLVLTWHSVIAAVKPGNYSLELSAPVTVRVRAHPQRDSAIDDLLGDPFMQNFFGATISKEITISGPPSDITVLALPAEGRPPNFSGAVGSFKVTGELSSPITAVGDPLTLRMHVTGSGNFDRVDSPMLDRLEQWKTYPPRSTYKPSEPTGYRGEKTFEQPLIASAPGPHTLPGLSFSYFDPSTRRYETDTTPPLSVTVTPPPGGNGMMASQTTTRVTGGGEPAAPPDGLRPDHVVIGPQDQGLVPAYLQPRYLSIPSGLVLAFAGGWLAIRARRRRDDDLQAARDHAAAQRSREAALSMESAARSRDPVRFLNAARATLQNHFAARWHVAPGDVTEDAIVLRLGGGPGVGAGGLNDGGSGTGDVTGLDGGALARTNTGSGSGTGTGSGSGSGSGTGANDAADVRRLFALADEVSYSMKESRAIDFEHWSAVVHRLLDGDPPP